MADQADSHNSHSNSLTNSEVSLHKSICKKCSEYEELLKEATNELSTAETVIKLLQEELRSTRPIYSTPTNNQIVMEGSDRRIITKDWTFITSKNNTEKRRRNDKRNNKQHKNEPIPPDQFIITSNRYTPLHNLEQDNMETTEFQNQDEQAQINRTDKPTKQQIKGQNIPIILYGQVQNINKRKPLAGNTKNNLKNSTQITNRHHKVVILGDSHTRGCAAGVKHLLSSDYEVCGSISPGAGMETIKDTARLEIQQLTKKDVVVLWGGSNDIARNNSLIGLKHIREFLINNNHTNVILMTAPHRHDLTADSCINKEVEEFNKKLHEKLEGLGKVEIIDAINERKFYTRHGQHMNLTGKDNMSKKIATTIELLINSHKEPIRGEGYKDAEINTQKHQDLQDTISNDLEEDTNECSECNNVILTGKDNMSKKIATTIELLINSDKEPINGEGYKDAEINIQKHQDVQNTTSNDPEEDTDECSECNSVFDSLDSFIANQRHQILHDTTSNDLEEEMNECNKFNSSIDESDPPKDGQKRQALQNSTSNDPEEVIYPSSESLHRKTSEEPINLVIPTHPRRNCPAKKNPDFLWA